MNDTYAIIKYQKLRDRLRQKVSMSATPIDGFIVGLSGTDSILTYILLSELANDAELVKQNRGFKVLGVHYMDNIEVPDSFQKIALPYLITSYGSPIECVELSQNVDQLRWADLHMRAINQPSRNKLNPTRFWVAGTVNATEKALGTYSIMSKSASIEPIVSLWKSDVLNICEQFNVPQQVLDNSRIPDCACGREEFASENIELIDALLRDNIPSGYTLEQVKKATDYIRNTKKEFGFKARTPYNV